MSRVTAQNNHSQPTFYQPLNQDRKAIRVLKVEAGTRAATLFCETFHISLLDDPKLIYETTSYCWGDAKETATILINGGMMDVPKSAKAALLCMRHEDWERILWIDAVCINQQGLDERARQVSILGDIYRNGQISLIYLGEDVETAQVAYEAIQLVLDDALAETENFRRWQEFTSTSHKGKHYAQPGYSHQLNTHPLENSNGQAWFRRLWIVQEAAVAPDNVCYCGDLQFPLTNVLRAAFWLQYHAEHIPFNLMTKLFSVGLLWDLVDCEYEIHKRTEGQPSSLCFFFGLARFDETSEPRDKVYAILGFTEWASRGEPMPSLVAPDYKKSVEEILRDATRLAVLSLPELNFYSGINFGWDEDETRKATPSWVPRWDQPVNGSLHIYELSMFFNAHDDKGAAIRMDCVGPGESFPLCATIQNECLSQDLDVLTLGGLTIDTVSSITRAMSPSNSDQQLASLLHFLEDVERLAGNIIKCGKR